jgi:hypothetical protein
VTVERTASGGVRFAFELPVLAVRVALACGSLVAALAALEVGTRVWYHPFLESEELALWTGEGEEVTPPLNRFGHREEELGADALGEDVTRVLFLGDSFTYGHGLADGSVRFTDRLERELARDGRRLHVYNAGVSGTNPTQWLETLEALGPEYRPDLVVGVFFLRCGTSIGTSFRFHQKAVRRARRPYKREWPYQWFALYRAWAERQVRSDFSDEYASMITSAYLGDEEETQRWRQEQSALLGIRDACAEQGAPFHLVVFPMLFELDDYPFGPVEDEIERFAGESGIPLHSLTPSFLGRSASSLWVSSVDQHPNAEGHRIAAEALLPWLESVLPAPE